METPHTPPQIENFTPETGALSLEFLAKPKDVLSLAYNGLRAAIILRREGQADARVAAQDYEADFYDSLGQIAEEVITDEEQAWPNLPPPPAERGFLDAQSNSQREIVRNKAAHGHSSRPRRSRRALYVDVDDTATPDLVRDLEPRSRAQRKAEQSLARNLHEIRDARKMNLRRRKILGGTGPTSGPKTAFRRTGEAIGSAQAFRRGDIDAFELERRRRARPATRVTNLPGQLEHSAHELEHSGDSILDGLDGAVDRAERRMEAAERSRDRLRTRYVTHRGRADRARARLGW